MLLPATWLPGLPLSGDELVRVRQGSGWVYPKLSDIMALSPSMAAVNATITALTQRVAADEAASVLLTQRVAVLEGKPDPCVALSGSLALATVQIGTVDVQVAVPGLLSTDRIAVEILADVPAGLNLGAMRPSPTANGVLLVQTTATLSLSSKPALPLAITALR